MGGSDNNKNRVLLTAREHYLCHWLLVKRYENDSIERKKMIKAWFIMAAVGNNLQRPTINKNTYAKYKEEFSKSMSIAQSNEKNSQYGKHWFTNLRTGESKSLFEKPDEFWVEGRNWFNREGKKLYSIKTKNKCVFHVKTREYREKENKLKITKDNILEPYVKVYNKVKKKYVNVLISKLEKQTIEAQKMWNDFHSGNYKNLLEFAKVLKISKVALRNRFYRYIPLYENIVKSNVDFKSNKDLIGVYEQLEFSKF